MHIREVSQTPQLDQMCVNLSIIENYVYQIATEDMHKDGINSILVTKPTTRRSK